MRERRAARYAAMEAENAALRARLAAAEDHRRADPKPADEPKPDYSTMPKLSDADSDEAYQASVKKWMDEQFAARGLAEQQAREKSRQAAEEADRRAAATGDDMRAKQLDERFGAALNTRFTAEQRAGLQPKLAAVRSKFAADPEANPRPIAKYVLDQRAALEAAGHLGDAARDVADVFADLYGAPEKLSALENLTDDATVLQGLASLDDPIPVVEYLASDEGKAEAEDLVAVARSNPSLAFRKLTVMEGKLGAGAGALQGRPEGGREPTQPAGPETTSAPPPGHSPRGAAGAAGSRVQDPPERTGGHISRDYIKRMSESAWQTTPAR